MGTTSSLAVSNTDSSNVSGGVCLELAMFACSSAKFSSGALRESERGQRRGPKTTLNALDVVPPPTKSTVMDETASSITHNEEGGLKNARRPMSTSSSGTTYVRAKSKDDESGLDSAFNLAAKRLFQLAWKAGKQG